MRDNHAQSPQELFNDVVRGLHQLPATDAITFRGTTSPRNRKPAILVTQSITATSRDLSAATAGLTSPGIAVVVLRTGRDLTPLSAVPEAQEIALPPGAVLYTGRFIQAAGRDVELIEQLIPDNGRNQWISSLTAQAVSQLTNTVTTAIANAKTRPCPTDPTYCRRFTAPLT